MNIDLVVIDGAVRRSVGRILKDRSDFDDLFSSATRDFRCKSGVRRIEDKAVTGFLQPFVERELARRSLADVKRVVRLLSSSSSSGAQSTRTDRRFGDDDIGGLARACLSLQAGRIGTGSSRTPAISLSRVSTSRCGKAYAIDASRVVKVVRLMHASSSSSGARTVSDFALEVDLGRAASRLGVAPEVLDAFPCISDASGDVAGLIVTRRIAGETLEVWLSKRHSRAKREALTAKLEAVIKRMHKASIFHNNLHERHVMVTRDGDPYVIDFGHATRGPGPFSRDMHDDFGVLESVEASEDDADADARGSRQMHRRSRFDELYEYQSAMVVEAIASGVARDLIRDGTVETPSSA